MFDLIAFIISMMIITIFILSILIWVLNYISIKNQAIIIALALLICLLLFTASFAVGTLAALSVR